MLSIFSVWVLNLWNFCIRLYRLYVCSTVRLVYYWHIWYLPDQCTCLGLHLKYMSWLCRYPHFLVSWLAGFSVPVYVCMHAWVCVISLFCFLHPQKECGFEYTSKLQCMFQDISVSKDLNDRFKSHIAATTPLQGEPVANCVFAAQNACTVYTTSIIWTIVVTVLLKYFVDRCMFY